MKTMREGARREGNDFDQRRPEADPGQPIYHRAQSERWYISKDAVNTAPLSINKIKADFDFIDVLVGAAGFEPTTCSTQNCRATRLRYTPIPLGSASIHA